MPDQKLFYVTVEETSQITLAIEAEDAASAESEGLKYVSTSAFLEDLTVTERAADARPADVYVALKDCVKPMTRGVDPVADARDHVRQALRDIINPAHRSKKQEYLDLAKAVLEEFEAEIAARPAAKMGM